MFDNLPTNDQLNNFPSSPQAGRGQGNFPPTGFNAPSAPQPPVAQPVAAPKPAGAEDIFSNVDTGPAVEKPPIFQPKPFASAPEDYDQDESGMGKKIAIVLGVIIVLALIGYGIWFVNKKFFSQITPNIVPDESTSKSLDTNKDTNVPAENNTVNNNKEVLPPDADKDGLSDEEEKTLGLDAGAVDSDNDGLFDRDEVKVYKTDPLKPDTDGDGFTDGDEVKSGNNPNGSGKLFEIGQTSNTNQTNTTKPTENAKNVDSDNDGLTDTEEGALGTNPNLADSDNDGLSDADEVKKYKTDPLKADTDGDGYTDGAEVKGGYNPNGAGKLN